MLPSRAEAKQIADRACDVFDRCLARGHSRAEAAEIAVAFVLSLHHDTPQSRREAWELSEDDEPR